MQEKIVKSIISGGMDASSPRELIDCDRIPLKMIFPEILMPKLLDMMHELFEQNPNDAKATSDMPAVWQRAPAKDLKGLCATRTGPTKSGDFSYGSEGVKILEVSPYGHISITTNLSGSNQPHILCPRWNDNNWTRAPESWCKQCKE